MSSRLLYAESIAAPRPAPPGPRIHEKPSSSRALVSSDVMAVSSNAVASPCAAPMRAPFFNQVPECTEDPLDERQVSEADVFDEATGKFLGEVELPEGVTLRASFIEGDAVYTPVEDEAGTIRVKRFRLVLPGDEQPAQ